MVTAISLGNDPSPSDAADEAAREELRRLGFTVLRDVLSSRELDQCRQGIDDELIGQEQSFDTCDLASIGELDTVRAPLVNNEFFLRSLVLEPRVNRLVTSVIGSYYLLHLQNAIINRPNRAHHQTAWHRDLPYLDRTSSAPLAVSALFCIDEFTVENGATWCLPASHLVGQPPSDAFLTRHSVAIEAGAGDVIVFDSMLFHRAGTNESSTPRRGVNNVYSVGLIRQQIDLPRALNGRYADDPHLAVLLGYASNAPVSGDDYRRQRLRRHGSG